jgi:putative ABC transport system substrate-binding protein
MPRASLTRPGGNITGFTPGEFSMGGKILKVLKEIVPRVSRVPVVLSLEQPPNVPIVFTNVYDPLGSAPTR